MLGFAASAAFEASGLERAEFDARVADLIGILPEVQIVRMKPDILAGLVKDPPETARRLLRFKIIFPGANVAAIAARRPSLLLEEFGALDARRALLDRLFGHAFVDGLVERQPILLVADIEQAVQDLKR